jgi:hypothetical protein
MGIFMYCNSGCILQLLIKPRGIVGKALIMITRYIPVPSIFKPEELDGGVLVVID